MILKNVHEPTVFVYLRGRKNVMDQKGKRILEYAVSLAVMAVILYFLFRAVKWSDFVEGLKGCRMGYVAGSMAAGIVAFWLRGVRWRQIVGPIDPSLSRFTFFNAINVGNLANFVFPRIGEFVRCGVITRRSVANHPKPESVPSSETSGDGARTEEGAGAGKVSGEVATYDKVVGTVVVERAWDVVTLFVFAAAILFLRWGKFGDFVVERMWRPMSESLNFSLWWIVAAILAVIAAFVVLVIKLKDRSKVCGAVCRFCRGIAQGFTAAFRMRAKWKFFLNTLLIWGMYWLMAAMTVHAIPSLGSLGPVDALFLAIAGSFGWLIPVPGGFGSYHFIVAIALQYIYGLDFSLGIVFATLSHESQAVTMMLTGIFSYLYETFKK